MIFKSKTVQIRLVEENDAEFILKLRPDFKYNQFLSDVNPNIQAQKDWIKYRDSHCKFEADPYTGGSIKPLIWLTCLEEITKERTKHLKESLKNLNQ